MLPFSKGVAEFCPTRGSAMDRTQLMAALIALPAGGA
jgi:hypothetical protein